MKQEYFCPITSFDWSAKENSIIATCSLDFSVKIWDIEIEKCESHFIAHNDAIYDICFQEKDILITCSNDQ